MADIYSVTMSHESRLQTVEDDIKTLVRQGAKMEAYQKTQHLQLEKMDEGLKEAVSDLKGHLDKSIGRVSEEIGEVAGKVDRVERRVGALEVRREESLGRTVHWRAITKGVVLLLAGSAIPFAFELIKRFIGG